MVFFHSYRCGRAMAGVDNHPVSQGQQLLMNTLQKRGMIPAWQVSPAYTTLKQNISYKAALILLAI